MFVFFYRQRNIERKQSDCMNVMERKHLVVCFLILRGVVNLPPVGDESPPRSYQGG